MAIKIGTNIPSLMAQRALNQQSDTLGRIFERLSSGQRINRAADDAAGLAISESLGADIRVRMQGVRNVNDGISLLEIADSALSQLSTITIRIRELAEQAANGTYSVKQRTALDSEAQALSREFERIIRSTEFNGVNLLTGELSSLRIQAGVGSLESIASSLGGVSGTGTFTPVLSTFLPNGTNTIKSGDLNGDGLLDLVVSSYTDGSFSVMLGRGDGTFAPRTTNYYPSSDPRRIDLADFNNDGFLDVLTAEVGAPHPVSIALGNGDGTFKAVRTAGVGDSSVIDIAAGDLDGDGYQDFALVSGSGELLISLGNGDGTFTQIITYSAGPGFNSVTIADMNRDGVMDVIAAGGTSAYLFRGTGGGFLAAPTTMGLSSGTLSEVLVSDMNGDGILDLVANSTNATSVAYGTGTGSFSVAYTAPHTGGAVGGIQVGDFNNDGFKDILAHVDSQMHIKLGNGNGTFSISSTTFSQPIQDSVVGDFNNDGVFDYAAITTQGIALYRGVTRDGVQALLPFSLTTISGARQTLSLMDTKLNLLNSQRSTIGAFSTRLTTAAAVLDSQITNSSAARSSIRDADIAEETAALVRAQILQQSAAAILAQANQQPALVLQLLDI